MTVDAPQLAGIHHVKLPVTDLDRSRQWYATRLGYRVEIEFVEQGQLMGLAMMHPNGGPHIALRRDPEWAARVAGFDFFAIGVPDEMSIRSLADRLTALGEQHAGVHVATTGWVLPLVHDPDGHEVRFYTLQPHLEPVEVERGVVVEGAEPSTPSPSLSGHRVTVGEPSTVPGV